MSKYTTTNQTYFFKKEIVREDMTYKLFAPLCNIHSRYIIEYKVPKVDVLDESAPETVSVLIQLLDTNPCDYKILNIYYRGRNHKAESFIAPYRILLDKLIPVFFT